MVSNARIESDQRRISGEFTVPDGSDGNSLRFVWDGAALEPDGSVVLIEDELSNIVPIHIHGHLARAALMNAAGERISRILWVVQDEQFEALWSTVELWREAARNHLGIQTPPCEYQNPEGERLMVSHDFN